MDKNIKEFVCQNSINYISLDSLGITRDAVGKCDLKCTPKVRHKTIRVLCIESLHLKNDWRLC